MYQLRPLAGMFKGNQYKKWDSVLDQMLFRNPISSFPPPTFLRTREKEGN